MKDPSSVIPNLHPRRRFLTAAAAGGAASLLAPNIIARATEVGAAETCGELTAADPLYLYQTLLPRLQVNAITAIHEQESHQAESLSDQIDVLYDLSSQLKAKLPRQSKLQPATDRLKSLAYIGRANNLAARAIAKTQSREVARAHSQSQRVITAEIIKAAVELPAQPDVSISAETLSLLQQILKKIDDIKKVYQPAADRARVTFDKQLQAINTRVLGIQSALLRASSNVVNDQKDEATRKINFALAELAKLPQTEKQTVPPNSSATNVANNPAPDSLTRDDLIAMFTATKQLINGTATLPRMSGVINHHASSLTVATISAAEIILPTGMVDTGSVRQIVRTYIPSGTWWQVVGVTAVCLPLWVAYRQSQQRKELIHNALIAVPREHGRFLWEAAHFLNLLTG
jgi:hypothetical protein